MPTQVTDIRGLEARRQRAISQADAVLQPAREADRGLTAEEERRFDTIQEEVERLTAQITGEQQRRGNLADAEEMRRNVRIPGIATDRESVSVEQHIALAEKEMRSVLATGKLLDGRQVSAPKDPLNNLVELRFDGVLLPKDERRQMWEERALSTITDLGGTEAAGGYLTSESMAMAIESAMLAYNAFRRTPATKIVTRSGEPIEMPMNDDTTNLGFRLTQGGNASSNIQDVAFTNKQLNAWTYSSGMIRASRSLIQDSRYNLPQWLGDALGTRISRIQAREDTKYSAAITGGSGPGPDQVAHTALNGPEAVLSFLLGAGADVVGKSLDRSDADKFDFAALVDLEMSVDAAYREMPTSGWMMSSKGLAAVKKLADNEGRPIWLPGNVAGGNPPTLFGYPYWTNEAFDWIPDGGTTTTGIFLFGDFSKIYLRDAMDIEVMALRERYAEFNQLGYIAWARHDCRVLDAGTHPLKIMTSVE